jgi:hypothetical protein
MEYIRDKNGGFFQIISLPIIWSILIPMVIFDFWIEVYHRICFPLYGIKYVRRSDYMKIDRYKLQYLNWYQKLGCVYCGYANGLAGYWVRITSDTEAYWCGIMHKKTKGFKAPSNHKRFVKYGNKKAFEKKYGKSLNS